MLRLLLPPIFLLNLLLGTKVNGCNEAVCGSIVSKCLLTQSCKCELKNCTCCRECSNCLNRSYFECCSCVDLCPKHKSVVTTLNRQFYVEPFDDDVPGLFFALTQYPDPLGRWTSFTYPVEISGVQITAKSDVELKMQSADSDLRLQPNRSTINCTVAYMNQCVNIIKCRKECASMGASSFRWFHNDCCECIGRTCINYGLDEPRCLNCSNNVEDLYEEVDGEDVSSNLADDDDEGTFEED